LAQAMRGLSFTRFLSVFAMDSSMMNWNKQPIPYKVALQIGWNLPADVVGAGVYGGISKRDEEGFVVVGDEWPENNRAPPAHNPVHSTGPFLDFSQLTGQNRGYTRIALTLMTGDVSKLEALFKEADNKEDQQRLANLVMAGGARPLHMCGMSRGGDASTLIETLINFGADVNAVDNYDMTPMDRLASNSVAGDQLLRRHGAVSGRQSKHGAPDWTSKDFVYTGPGEA